MHSFVHREPLAATAMLACDPRFAYWAGTGNAVDSSGGLTEMCIRDSGIYLDQLQIAFHLLIQDVVGHIAVARLCNTTSRLTEDTLGRVAVHRKAKGIGMEHICLLYTSRCV